MTAAGAAPSSLRPRPVGQIRDWWHDEGPVKNLNLTWTGQAGFLIRYGLIRIVIDPYLSDSLAEKYRGKKFPHQRMTEIPIKPEEVSGADLLLCTHEHTDHLDPGSLSGIISSSPRSMCIVPRFSIGKAIERGVAVNRIASLSAGETLQLPNGVDITAIPAAHEEYVEDEAGNSKFLGYRIEVDGIVVYHSGDTIPNPHLEAALKPGIDIALFPVNGRDEKRRVNGIPGNLTIEEALTYHRRFECENSIVHHIGMFDFNTLEPEELQRVIDSQQMKSNVIIPQQGVIYERSR